MRTDADYLRKKSARESKKKEFKPIAKVSKKKLKASEGNLWQATQIPKFSSNYAKEVAKYNKRAPEWKKEHPICEYPGCTHKTDDLHHQIGRGIHLLDENFWMALCRMHHNLCKSLSKEELVKLGLIYLRSAKKPLK